MTVAPGGAGLFASPFSDPLALPFRTRQIGDAHSACASLELYIALVMPGRDTLPVRRSNNVPGDDY